MLLQTPSLERLKTAGIHDRIVESIGEERLREFLREEAVSFGAMNQWKRSNEPKFETKPVA